MTDHAKIAKDPGWPGWLEVGGYSSVRPRLTTLTW
jgi:hypothetical protein